MPLLVSEKKVSNEPVSPRLFASVSGRPSAFKPCSNRYLGDFDGVSVDSQLMACDIERFSIQLPCAASKLSAGLSDVQMKNLMRYPVSVMSSSSPDWRYWA